LITISGKQKEIGKQLRFIEEGRMRNLKARLREFLRLYEIRSRRITADRVIDDPGIDYDMNEAASFRQELEKNKHLLTPEELTVLEEADRNFFVTWEKVKDVEPETPYNRIAKAFLEDIVRLARKSLSAKSST